MCIHVYICVYKYTHMYMLSRMGCDMERLAKTRALGKNRPHFRLGCLRFGWASTALVPLGQVRFAVQYTTDRHEDEDCKRHINTPRQRSRGHRILKQCFMGRTAVDPSFRQDILQHCSCMDGTRVPTHQHCRYASGTSPSLKKKQA